ncbi:hypothetical protein [Gordonia insulae]|uniref:Uncharacterized protein n=1 Tax=Gordonia insulae TaxID=2420509 RepID=A0A3G8JM25_9ACTN|nr:hypothetical protein [Gordonia insulae]AZG45632.1 hypothetical protein D7316_02228 [Gordonia insulae]
MGESLKADPEWISGLGNYLIALNGNAWKAVNLVDGHAQSTGEFKGLMSTLKGPVDSLHEATASRLDKMPPVLSQTGANLKQAAWDYTSTDHESGLGIRHTQTKSFNTNPFIPPGDVEFGLAPDPVVRWEEVDDVPGSRTFTSPREVDAAAPPVEGVDWNALIQEAAGWLGDADSAIRKLTGWSPIEQALDPVAGNWMELKRIGKTYGKAGGAFDIIAGDLISGHKEVDVHWDGKAATAYSSYSTDMVRGLNWEGSIGRLLERGLTLAADELQKAAKEIIRLVKEGLGRLIKVDGVTDVLKLASKWVPYVGTAAAIEQVRRLILEVYDATKVLLDEVERGMAALKDFIEFCKDPVGFAKGKAEAEVKEQLKPFTDRLDKARDAEQLGNDIGTVAQWDRLDRRPSSAYDPGTGPTLWEDAP